MAHDENKNAETVENGSNAEGNVNQNPVNQPMEVLQPTTPDKAQPVVVQMTLDQKEEEEAARRRRNPNPHRLFPTLISRMTIRRKWYWWCPF